MHYNPYENYLNQNYFFIKEVYDAFQTKVQVALTIVQNSFPFPQSIDEGYGFPSAYWKKEDWGNTTSEVRTAAKAYAMMFARTYAPTAADCPNCEAIVDVLEMSNESWGYRDPEFYKEIVQGFVAGIEEYYTNDPTNKIILIPGAFQANHLENDAIPNRNDFASWKDYIGTKLPEELKCYINGSNYHPYSNDQSDNESQMGGCFGERLIAHPEKSGSKFLFVKNGWKWNELNMPAENRNIYVTEYGWDTETPISCNPSEGNCILNAIGVGEAAQGIYLTRSTSMLARFGTLRAQPYELLDEDVDPEISASRCFGYHSSGIWNQESMTEVSEKVSTRILRKFINLVGDKKFHYAISEENEGAYAYALEDSSGIPLMF